VPGRGGPTDPSHDANLRRGILHTDVTRKVAGFLVVLFLCGIYAVPISQVVLERVKGDDSVLPDLFRRWPTKDTIKQFEEDLDKASYSREAVRPRLQYVFTRFGGFGNTKAVVGRDGWLFYQPGVTAVGGPGFLDPAILDSRARAARDDGAPALHPDPRPAILAFSAFLAGRGIRLVLFPVPDKAGLQPIELHGRGRAAAAAASGEPGGPAAGQSPGRNVDQPRLERELEGAGVLIFDPTPERLGVAEPPRFLRQDTHWTPEWMEQVAQSLATFVTVRVPLGPPSAAERATFTAIARPVARVGDVVDMLGLPPGQTLFAPQPITVHEVHDAAGALFEPSPEGDVLLLGDSFTNVFTLGQMGWGEAAGLGPQLARALGRKVDVIAQNDSGAYATRQLLWNELTSGEEAPPAGPEPRRDRLTGKKVVIWELASRELAVGNWKPLDWSRAGSVPKPTAARMEPAPRTGRAPGPAGDVTVVGSVQP
jgi:alginate O-acetyltransferase complex protein AlgJ